MLGEGEQSGRIKVLDFGLAKVVEAPLDGTRRVVAADRGPSATPVTAEGHILGTVAVHVTRASRGAGDRRAVGFVFPRRRALRDGHRASAVRRRHQPVDSLVDPQGHAPIGHRPQPRTPARSRTHHPSRPREGSRAPLSERERPAERSRGSEGLARLGRSDGAAVRLTRRLGSAGAACHFRRPRPVVRRAARGRRWSENIPACSRPLSGRSRSSAALVVVFSAVTSHRRRTNRQPRRRRPPISDHATDDERQCRNGRRSRPTGATSPTCSAMATPPACGSARRRRPATCRLSRPSRASTLVGATFTPDATSVDFVRQTSRGTSRGLAGALPGRHTETAHQRRGQRHLVGA